MAIIHIGVPFKTQEESTEGFKPFLATTTYDFKERFPKAFENLIDKYRSKLSILSEEAGEEDAFWLTAGEGLQLLDIASRFNQDDIIVKLSEGAKNDIYNIKCLFAHYTGEW